MVCLEISKISSVLHKLHGRAANYKDKYRDLVKKYNEVVSENQKCRVSSQALSHSIYINRRYWLKHKIRRLNVLINCEMRSAFWRRSWLKITTMISCHRLFPETSLSIFV